MYGSETYGNFPYGGISQSGVAAIECVADIVLLPSVQIGADQDPRECTVVVECGLSVSVSSTIPTYAVGMIAPVVSASISGSTTVIGTGAIQVPISVASYAIYPLPISANIVVRVRTSIAASMAPAGIASIFQPVSVSVSGLVVTHARAAITIPSYVSASSVTGFVGNISATIPSAFSATVVHSKTSSTAIVPLVYVSGVLSHGCEISGAVPVTASVSSLASAHGNVTIDAQIEIPVYPYMRCAFNENSSSTYTFYVQKKQTSVFVTR